MVYFKTKEAFFKGGLHLRALKRVGCRILSRPIRVWGKQGACHKDKSGKLKVGSVKAVNAFLNDYALKFLFLGLR